MKKNNLKLQTKNARLSFRCTKSEKEAIRKEAKLANHSTTKYLISLATETTKIENHKALLSIVDELPMCDRIIGNDLNRFAHRLNSQTNVSPADIEEFVTLLQRIAIKRDDMIKKHREIYHLLKNR